MSRLREDGCVLKLLFAKAIQKKINNCFSDFVERRQRDDDEDEDKKGTRISGLRKLYAQDVHDIITKQLHSSRKCTIKNYEFLRI